MRPLALTLLLSGCAPGNEPPGEPGVDPPASGDPTPDEPAPDTPDPVDSDPVSELRPGRFAVRRLNRDEYDHTVRDLLGTALRPGREFPAEARSAGFDNVADALTVSPVWLELADKAAAALAAEATRPPLTEPWTTVLEGEAAFMVEARGDAGGTSGPAGDELAMYVTGTAFAAVEVPVADVWTLSFRLRAEHALDEPLRCTVTVNGTAYGALSIPSTESGPVELVIDAPLAFGANVVALSYDNDYRNAAADRNLFLDRLTVHGPVAWSPGVPEPYQRVMVCEPDKGGRDCARQVLEAFTPRAWRRPVAPDEIDALLALYDEVLTLGERPQAGVEALVHAVLTSPHFLLLIEPSSPTTEPVTDHELASRLSYFLWGSMPDDTLRALADAGTLHDAATLDAQVDRMLADPRADVLVSSFASQWLGMQLVDGAVVSGHTLDDWTPETRASMRQEMETFFRTFLTTDRPFSELLTTHEAFADPVLASYLRIPPPGPGFVAYDGAPWNRGGWLTQAGLLLALSHPDRTSPVKRGAWVLDALLCAPPAAPPPGIPPLDPTATSPATVREALAAHRANPGCASCHDAIDPIGLALERYDEGGHYRPTQDGVQVDASGGLPGGVIVNGARELQDAIAADPAFDRCVAEKVFTWSHHRAPSADDEPTLDALAARFVGDGEALRALLRAVVHTDSFRLRQGAP